MTLSRYLFILSCFSLLVFLFSVSSLFAYDSSVLRFDISWLFLFPLSYLVLHSESLYHFVRFIFVIMALFGMMMFFAHLYYGELFDRKITFFSLQFNFISDFSFGIGLLILNILFIIPCFLKRESGSRREGHAHPPVNKA